MTLILTGCLLIFGAFQMPEVNLSDVEGLAIDSLRTNLPHAESVTTHITLRTGEGDDPLVRAGAFYRYAFDLYQLNEDKDCILPNLKALRNELLLVGDQGKCMVEPRIKAIQEIETAIEEDAPKDSVLVLFSKLNSNIQTLAGERRPCGADAYDLGRWIAAMGVRLAIYPGCSEQGKAYLLSHVSTLIETVEKEDSDNWNAVVNTSKDSMNEYKHSRVLEFISGLPYQTPLSEDDLSDLLAEVKTTYTVYELEFVFCI